MLFEKDQKPSNIPMFLWQAILYSHQIITSRTMTTKSADLHPLIMQILDDNKGQDIVSIDLADKSSIADTMVIATARSSRHLDALAEHLNIALKHLAPIMIEGKDGSQWVVVDTFSVIVHLFTKDARELYDLEKLWGTPSLFSDTTE